jgi:CBS domain containing-hemolysin-like protein
LAKNILVINVDIRETRVALIEGGIIAELHLERQSAKGTLGNVYLGKVSRVLPGMQAAFIDIGQERAAFLHVEDLFPALRQPPAQFKVADHLREALTVPETLKADEVLEEMKRHRTHHAVVIDEYGGTAGLVTFEGLMERIVGEVGSEFSQPGTRISVLPDGSALIDGLALTTDVNEQFALHIDEAIYTTVGGFVLGCLGRRARLGDRVEVEGRTLRVEALDHLRVARVYLSAPKGGQAQQRSA